MATQDTILNTFSNIFTNYGPSVFNGLIIVSTISGQSLIRKLTFSCPCAYPLNIIHATAFIFGPSIALLIFGITINQNTWKLVHGCCFRVTSTRHQWKTIIVYWISIISQALIAPIAWLFVAFLDGGYYQCLRAGDYCPLSTSPQCQNSTAMALDPLYNALSKSGTELLIKAIESSDDEICAACICTLHESHAKLLQSESQVIAWMLLILVGVSAMTIICFIRMFDKYTYVQNTYVGNYRAEERKIFEAEAKEHARRVAEQNCKQFFEQGKWSKADWDSVSSVPFVANTYIWDKHLKADIDPHLYTPLQVWTNRKTVHDCKSNPEGSAITPILNVPIHSEA